MYRLASRPPNTPPKNDIRHLDLSRWFFARLQFKYSSRFDRWKDQLEGPLNSLFRSGGPTKRSTLRCQISTSGAFPDQVGKVTECSGKSAQERGFIFGKRSPVPSSSLIQCQPTVWRRWEIAMPSSFLATTTEGHYQMCKCLANLAPEHEETCCGSVG